MNNTMMNTDTLDALEKDPKLQLRIVIIVVLSIAVAALVLIPGEWGKVDQPAPNFTGKIISVVPATAEDKTRNKVQGEEVLGTVLVQGSDGYQLLLRAYHADGCSGGSALRLSKLKVGQTVDIRYWPDTPETASNPHKGSAVMIDGFC